MLNLNVSKIVAGEDGKAWLCIPVSSDDVDAALSLFLGLVGDFRAMRGKVKNAELTRYREPLVP